MSDTCAAMSAPALPQRVRDTLNKLLVQAPYGNADYEIDQHIAAIIAALRSAEARAALSPATGGGD